eukprot:gene5898-biopygen5052
MVLVAIDKGGGVEGWQGTTGEGFLLQEKKFDAADVLGGVENMLVELLGFADGLCQGLGTPALLPNVDAEAVLVPGQEAFLSCTCGSGFF